MKEKSKRKSLGKCIVNDTMSLAMIVRARRSEREKTSNRQRERNSDAVAEEEEKEQPKSLGEYIVNDTMSLAMIVRASGSERETEASNRQRLRSSRRKRKRKSTCN